jgi:hypothetical protein
MRNTRKKLKAGLQDVDDSMGNRVTFREPRYQNKRLELSRADCANNCMTLRSNFCILEEKDYLMEPNEDDEKFSPSHLESRSEYFERGACTANISSL